MKTTLLRFAAGVAAALTLSLLTACGASSEDTAGNDDRLEVLCTVEENWCEVMVEAFEAETGIETAFTRLSGGDALTALRDAKSDPRYSVWWGGSADGYVAANAEGLLASYVSPNADAIPSASKDSQGAWTGVYAGALGFCSNETELTKLGLNAPASWQELINTELEGRVSIAHPSTSGTAYTALWTLFSLNDFDEAATFAYLTALDKNVAEYTRSGAAPVGIAADGTAAVAIVFAHDCAAAIDAGSDHLKLTFPSEGTGFETGATALVAGAPNAETGKKWIDWALTPEAQELGIKAKAYQLPLNPDASVPALSVKLDSIELVDYDFGRAGEQRQTLSARFEEQVAPRPE